MTIHEWLTPEALTPEALTPEAPTPEAPTPEALTPEAPTPEAPTPDENTPYIRPISNVAIEKGQAYWLTPKEAKTMEKNKVYNAWGGDVRNGMIRVFDLDKAKLVGIVRYLMEFPRPRSFPWLLIIAGVILSIVMIFVIFSMFGGKKTPEPLANTGSTNTGQIEVKKPVESSFPLLPPSMINTWTIQPTEQPKVVQKIWTIEEENGEFKANVKADRLQTLLDDRQSEILELQTELNKAENKKWLLQAKLDTCEKAIEANTVDPYTEIKMKIWEAVLQKCKEREIDDKACQNLIYSYFTNQTK